MALFEGIKPFEVELPGNLLFGVPGETGATFTPYVDKDGFLHWTNDKDKENPEPVDLKVFVTQAVAEDIKKLKEDVADLQYEPIKILSMTNNVGTVEMGTVVRAISIEWQTSKTPAAMTFDGEEKEVSEGETDFAWISTMENITADRTWTVAVTDERGAQASASTAVKFLNGVYYGLLEDGAVIDSAAVLSLTRELRSNKTKTFTVNAGASERIAYAVPTRYGSPNFNVGGFDGGFKKAATIDFTNASGYTEKYDVWLSDNTGLGSTTVKVT